MTAHAGQDRRRGRRTRQAHLPQRARASPNRSAWRALHCDRAIAALATAGRLARSLLAQLADYVVDRSSLTRRLVSGAAPRACRLRA